MTDANFINQWVTDREKIDKLIEQQLLWKARANGGKIANFIINKSWLGKYTTYKADVLLEIK